MLLPLVIFALIGCRGEKVGVPDDATLRTEVSEIESSARGPVRFEKTFRGAEMIMMVMTDSNSTTRTLLFQGDVRYIESDEDGDGHFESVMLPGAAMDEFELFTRHRDGTIEPMAEAEYLTMRQRAAAATADFQRALNDARNEAEK